MEGKTVWAGAAVVVCAPLLVVVLVLVMVAGGGVAPAGACGVPGVGADASKVPGPVAGYGPDQLKIAAIIVNAGKKAGVSVKGQLIGVVVGMGESSLQNLDHGDEHHGVVNTDGSPTCSLGVFQQQWCLPGHPWGTKADVTDPATASGMFFQALLRLDGWEALAPAEAGHRAQGNYSPAAYTQYIDAAQAVLEAVTNGKTAATAPGCRAVMPGSSGKGDDYPFTSGVFNADNPVTGFAFKNCTDFAWWRMMQQLGITDPSQMDARTLGPGSAITWGPTWQRVGWTVSMTPKVGAIIWYGPGNPGGDPTYGHVAVVKAVEADGRVLEEGYNFGIPPNGAYYTRTIAAGSPSGYLYIPTKDQFALAA